MTTSSTRFRIGIDLGGTKIAGIVLGAGDVIAAEVRVASPQQDYEGTVRAVAALVDRLQMQVPTAGGVASVGIGMPGSISPATGLVQNANSTWLNGRPFQHDLEAVLGRALRLSNDANCFALSEAHDGAAAGAASVFGVIIGTGCGGGLVIGGRLHNGPHGIAGEWGHTPLPWVRADEVPGPRCWCGQHGCLETWVSGPALAADVLRVTGLAATTEAIVQSAAGGDGGAQAALDRHTDRLARGLALIANVLDPHMIVLGGGLSKLDYLYAALPGLMARHMFADHAAPAVHPPRWGDASGVRGAARLWD
jgi:fructokinase